MQIEVTASQAFEVARDLTRDLLDEIKEVIETLPCPEDGQVDWGHFGTLQHANQQLKDALSTLSAL